MNIYVIGAVAAVLAWGSSGIASGAKFLWHNRGCIVRHGIHACKVQVQEAQKIKEQASADRW